MNRESRFRPIGLSHFNHSQPQQLALNRIDSLLVSIYTQNFTKFLAYLVTSLEGTITYPYLHLSYCNTHASIIIRETASRIKVVLAFLKSERERFPLFVPSR